MGERTDRDHLGAGLTQRIEQAQLLRDRDVGALDLQAFPHRVVGDGHSLGHHERIVDR
jgi:hypothetical protein